MDVGGCFGLQVRGNQKLYAVMRHTTNLSQPLLPMHQGETMETMATLGDTQAGARTLETL